MPMNTNILGDAIIGVLNTKSDTAIINKLGDAMYDAMLTVIMNQGSDPDGNLGRLRFRKVAEMILDNFFLDTGGGSSTNKKRLRGLAGVIISHISQYATIAPLSTTSTPAGTGPHIHSPITITSSSKIS